MSIGRRFPRALGTVLVLLGAFAPPAMAGTSDGSVLSITKIQDNGPDASRFNIVIMGDGFTAADMATFETRAQQVVDAFNAEVTYGACGGAINFYRVNIESDQSGSDKPAPCYSPTVSRDTYLDTNYCGDGETQRCIWTSNQPLVLSTASAATPNWHYVVVLVNDAEQGGCAQGGLTFNSTGSGFESTVLHELGHALGGLGDEYDYGGDDTFSGGEPGDANLTIETNRADVKWFDLIEETTPFPTWNRASCLATSAEFPPASLEGRVGSLEGGAYNRCGIYHPERTCLMRELFTDFCAVCNRRIRQVMAEHLSTGNLSITPWGYFQNPKVSPYWQTPDVWVDNDLSGTQDPNEPLIGKPDNHLFARVRNTGTQPSGTFQVRFSYVPYTTVIDLANSQPITTVTRPSLTGGGTDEVEVTWPLNAVPPEFAGIDHFCVIVEILHDECTTGDNRTQNNFTSVQTLMPSPAVLPFFVTNILDVAAFGALEIDLNPRRPGWQISGNVPDLSKIALAPHETKKIVLNLGYRPPQSDEPDQPPGGDEVVDQDFDITFRLEGQVLGGVSSHVRVLPETRRDWSLSLHLGEALPQGDFGHLYDQGPSVVLDAGYRLTRNLSLIGLLGYHRFDAAVAGTSDTHLWSFSIDLRWEPRTGRVRPYLQAGPGVYFPESGSSEAGYNLGVGMSFKLTPAWDLEVGTNYHTVPGFVPDVEFFQPLVGLIYRF